MELSSPIRSTGAFVVSPVRLKRFVPRPEDSVQVRACMKPVYSPYAIDPELTPDYRLKVPARKDSPTFSSYGKGTERRFVPRPDDSTQVECLLKSEPPVQPSFQYTLRSSSRRELGNDPLLEDRPRHVYTKSKTFDKSMNRCDQINEKFVEKPLVETIRAMSQARNNLVTQRSLEHRNSVFNSSARRHSAYRVGEHSGVMNALRPDLALPGVVRSNLPSLEGVPGLGDLNLATWEAAGGVPNNKRRTHASSKLHPTYRTHQVEKMLDDEHSEEILETLRARGTQHSPIRRFVDAGQGNSSEIYWVQQTKHAREQQEARRAVVDAKLFVYERDKKRSVVDPDNFASGLFQNSMGQAL
jgi:hypothetical protein